MNRDEKLKKIIEEIKNDEENKYIKCSIKKQIKLKNYKIFIKILTFYKLCDNIKWCMEIKYFE